MTPTDLEARLRMSLADHAGDAPPGGPLADRILAELDAPVLRPRRAWRTWTFPFLAAAAIAAVALAVVGLGTMRFSATPGTHNRAATHAVPSVRPSPPVSAAPYLQPRIGPVFGGVAGLQKFVAADTTFYGDSDAWALGSARCSAGSARTCAALAATTDGGWSWHRAALPGGVTVAHATCAAGCVQGVRFANDQAGYLFGPQTFFLFDGQQWTQQPGGAIAVETLDNTVIRVSLTDDACTGTCRYQVSYSGIGATTWTAAAGLPALAGDGVQLVRTKGISYLLVRNGGTGRLYRSPSGATWTSVPGCVGLNGIALARAALYLQCETDLLVDPNTPSAYRTALPGGTSAVRVSAVGPHTLFAAADALYRSTDSGTSWQVVLDHPADPTLPPPGFQSESVGRWLTDGGRDIWTTTDGGRSWTGLAFSR
jgi:photosystem II stability/assembly factor-like uncharacterized protein